MTLNYIEERILDKLIKDHSTGEIDDTYIDNIIDGQFTKIYREEYVKAVKDHFRGCTQWRQPIYEYGEDATILDLLELPPDEPDGKDTSLTVCRFCSKEDYHRIHTIMKGRVRLACTRCNRTLNS